MSFCPDPAGGRIREEARATAESLVAPDAEARDRAAVFPSSTIRSLAAQGWLGMRAGADAGGMDLDVHASLVAVTEFSRACASVGLLVGFHNILVCEAIRTRGSAAARSELLSRLAQGGLFGAAAFTDPVGSRPAEPEAAVATPTGAGYVLRGAKSFVPGALGADLLLVYAFLEDPAGTRRDRCLLLVPRETEGVVVDPPDPLVGVRASGTATVRFEACVIGPDWRLSPGESARAIAREILAAADLVVAAQAVGIGEAAFEKAIRRAGEREPGGGRVGGREAVQFKIADMRTSLDASALFVMRAAFARERRDPDFACCAAQAKAFAGRAAVRVADEAIQIHGGTGSLAGHGIERHWRDAKTTELNPSTRETALLAVARYLLEEAAG